MMISDQIVLGGTSTYLRTDSGSANLVDASASTVSRTPALPSRQVWDVAGLEILLESDSLEPLLHLPDSNATPFLEIRLVKELFPDVFANTFETRMHGLSGFKDFENGTFSNCIATIVDDYPTLVSIGTEQCQWASTVYKLPVKVDVFAASWDLAVSRLGFHGQCSYDIELRLWIDTNTNRTPDQIVTLAEANNPTDPRRYIVDDGQSPLECQAFQVVFTADVKVDASFYETHRLEPGSAGVPELPAGQSIGMPLLRSFRLLERVASDYTFWSLHELIQKAGFYQLLDPPNDSLRRLLVFLDVPGQIDGNASPASTYEHLEVRLSNAHFSRVQIRLQGSERLWLSGEQQA